MYLWVRAIHVLFGAIWVGIAVFGAWILKPLTTELGSDAAKVQAIMRRRGFVAGMPILALTTILSGLALYYRFTGHFSPEGSRTHAAMAYGLGGGLAIIAFLIGALLISRSMIKAGQLAQGAGSAKTADERNRMLSEAAALRARAGQFGDVVAVLVTITIVLMAIGLYM
jgi:hypothetical protein